ncbi:CatB-related O-acetyltransferase [Campylobacter troglodytis]|uniref:CatB-related O-acetyltransferase n=1 Tax=Campylobacter troglodytis TaxID=654363 RepID=UPI00115AF26C|nr:CatB-related O-acetyltransferase [Campylobacter troglodytis]TQR60214.1 hypothetical protein DMC01_06870 [Campylobacter troglodytis]
MPQIILNKFAIEYLMQNNIHNRFTTTTAVFKEGDKLIVPDGGYAEEFCSQHGAVYCQMGAISYSNSPLRRTDIKIGRYCSFAAGWGFIADKHPLHLITTSSCNYDGIHSIFKDSSQKFNPNFKPSISYAPFSSAGKKTIIENDVYICTDALIKPGITLHTGCVIAQRAVVTKDVPPYAIVGGMPAKIIKYRFDEATRARLLASKWWEYHFSSFAGMGFHKGINAFLDEFERRVEKDEIKPFSPLKMHFEELIERSKFVGNVNGIAKNSELFLIGACERVKEHLSYKIGILLDSNTNFFLLLVLILNALHKKGKKAHLKEAIKMPLSAYEDYEEALRLQKSRGYRLGNAFVNVKKLKDEELMAACGLKARTEICLKKNEDCVSKDKAYFAKDKTSKDKTCLENGGGGGEATFGKTTFVQKVLILCLCTNLQSNSFQGTFQRSPQSFQTPLHNFKFFSYHKNFGKTSTLAR